MGRAMMKFALLVWVCLLLGKADGQEYSDERLVNGSIAFATLSRARYDFDIFSVSLPGQLAEISERSLHEIALTDGVSVNYNGQLVGSHEKSHVFHWLEGQGITVKTDSGLLVYVSERTGSPRIYFNLLQNENQEDEPETQLIQEFGTSAVDPVEIASVATRMIIETGRGHRTTVPVDVNSLLGLEGVYLHDRPSIAGGRMVYTSTAEPRQGPRQSWTAVYSAAFHSGRIVRLTPQEVADFSPSISPSGDWVMAATDEGRGWTGEVQGLNTDLYVYRAQDGSQRRLVTRNGGWPSWADDANVFFHRLSEDGWWSIFRIRLSEDFLLGGEGEILREERVTPAGVHAFTPAASQKENWIAVATRRSNSEYRHVEIFDLVSKSFIKLTELVSPDKNHYNPFVLSSGTIGYHRCRSASVNPSSKSGSFLNVEQVPSPIPLLSLLRVEGSYPSFSPDGSRVAYLSGAFDSVNVINLDGSGKRKLLDGHFIGTAWDRKREGVLYVSSGRGFSSELTSVDVIAILNVDGDKELEVTQLTKEGTGNNAFPSPSSDGRHVVFRSGRTGHKNLYIMDAIEGEEKEIWRLTDGAWTDTMCNWSPDGKWIAFASDRDNPGSGSFAIYLIHPDGTGLHMVLHSAQAGRVNHPWFSPDSKSLVFTSDYAAVSAEPISLSHHYQPYGDIFIAKIDGSQIQRLTHNSYEDGTPAWGTTYIAKSDLSKEGGSSKCEFTDCFWLQPPKALMQEPFRC